MELGGAQAPALLAMGCNMIQLLYTHSKPRQLSMSRPLHHKQLKTSISVTGQLGNRPTKNIRNFSNGTVEHQLNNIFASSLGRSVCDGTGSTMKWHGK